MGSFSTDTGVQLNLRIQYDYSTNYSSRYTDVTCTAYIDCYSLHCGDLGGNYLCMGADDYYFNGAVSVNGGPNSVWMQSHTTRVYHDSSGNASLYTSAKWNFRGTYSGKYIDNLYINGTIYLPNVGPETPPTPDPPGRPNNPTVSGKFEMSVPCYLHTDAVPGATKYDWQYELLHNNVWTDYINWTTTSSNDAQDAWVYTWASAVAYRVRAGNDGGWGPWSYPSNVLRHYGVHANNMSSWGFVKVYNNGSWYDGMVKVYNNSSWIYPK